MAIILTNVDTMPECGRENINKRIKMADIAMQEQTPMVESQKSPIVADMLDIFTINKYIKILKLSLICFQIKCFLPSLVLRFYTFAIHLKCCLLIFLWNYVNYTF
jgi:hypothetical protein